VGVDDFGIAVLDFFAGTFGPGAWQGGEDFEFVACWESAVCLEDGRVVDVKVITPIHHR
jgi:hypothetical protein